METPCALLAATLKALKSLFEGDLRLQHGRRFYYGPQSVWLDEAFLTHPGQSLNGMSRYQLMRFEPGLV